METKETMAPASGVTVIGAEAHSNYHVAPRADGPPHITVSPSSMALTTPPIAGAGMEKKKRGRPRKYGPDGAAARPLSPRPISSSAPPSTTGHFSAGKRGRGRSSGSLTKHRVEIKSIGIGAARSDGSHFTPHVIDVNAGEDVTAKIISFCQQGPRAICILSANGTISNATIRQSDSSGGTLTYEGRFEIVSLCGSFTPTRSEGTTYRSGGLSVSLSSPNGQVVGGCVAGLLVAAGPVQIIVGSFLPSTQPERKPKKQKAHSNPTPTPFVLAADNKGEIRNSGVGVVVGQGNMNVGITNHLPSSTSPLPFQKEGTTPWSTNAQHLHHHHHHHHHHNHNHAATPVMQDPRNPTTDINISLPAAGMQ